MDCPKIGTRTTYRDNGIYHFWNGSQWQKLDENSNKS